MRQLRTLHIAAFLSQPALEARRVTCSFLDPQSIIMISTNLPPIIYQLLRWVLTLFIFYPDILMMALKTVLGITRKFWLKLKLPRSTTL